MFQTIPAHTGAAPVRRALLVAAAAILVAVGPSPATAAPVKLPIDREPAPVAALPPTSTTDALRAALEALPDSAAVHVSEIVKNFAQGVLS